MGVSGHGGGLYPVDAAGRPVRGAFTSMDGRAAPVVDAWTREGRFRYAATRHHPWAGRSIPQLRWLRDHALANYERVRWALSSKDWMVLRLTGEISTDRTDASNQATIDLETGRYDAEAFSLFGVPEVRGKVPPVHESAEVVGRGERRGRLPHGPEGGDALVAGMYDVIACAVGSGALDENNTFGQ